MMNKPLTIRKACPKGWLVVWKPKADEPGGRLFFTQRAAANGFKMMRKACGFDVAVYPQ